QSMPTNHSISSAMLGPPLASLTPGPPQRASIPVLALEAQPPTGLPSRPTYRGAGPFQVLKTQDSRATPGRPARFGQSTMPTSHNRPEGYKDSNHWSLPRGIALAAAGAPLFRLSDGKRKVSNFEAMEFTAVVS